MDLAFNGEKLVSLHGLARSNREILPRVFIVNERFANESEAEAPSTIASPQAEDGHVDIANEIIEALARTNLSAYEWRILCAVWRKTYGWHKKADMISITQFQKMTGLKRQHVSRTISQLLQRNIVTRIGDSRISTYGFQKDYTKWKNVTKRGDYAGTVRVSERVRQKTVTRIGDRSSPNGVTTKETNKRKKYAETDSAFKLAHLLLNEIQKSKPDLKMPNIQVWARDIDLMIRKDGRPAERVERAIRWATADRGNGSGTWRGWSAVILSAGNLRDKFDRIEKQMQGAHGRSNATW